MLQPGASFHGVCMQAGVTACSQVGAWMLSVCTAVTQTQGVLGRGPEAGWPAWLWHRLPSMRATGAHLLMLGQVAQERLEPLPQVSLVYLVTPHSVVALHVQALL